MEGRLRKIRRLGSTVRSKGVASKDTRPTCEEKADEEFELAVEDEEVALGVVPQHQPLRIVCLPTSVIEGVQTNELQLVLLAQLSRCLALHRVNRVIVLDDYSYRASSPSFDAGEFISRVMSYLETPQYLRKRLFPLSPMLRNIGYATPLDCPHHLRESDACEFREGVVERRPVREGEGSWVDIGLRQPCRLDLRLEEGTRVTVRIEEHMFPHRRFYRGQAVSPATPQRERGLYWGFTVERAATFSEVFRLCGDDCLRLLVDPEAPKRSPSESRIAVKAACHAVHASVLLFFSGKGLQTLFESDEKTKMTLEALRGRFALSLCSLPPEAGVRSLYLHEQVSYFSAQLFT